MKNKQGFTLIEVLVVVSIIGIIATIVVPGYMAYRNRNVHSPGKTVQSQVAEHINVEINNKNCSCECTAK